MPARLLMLAIVDGVIHHCKAGENRQEIQAKGKIHMVEHFHANTYRYTS